MVWQCTSCEGENLDDTLSACEHCGYVYYDTNFYDYQYQDTDQINQVTRAPTKRSTCELCYHKHYYEEFCHVFIESDIPEKEDGDEDNQFEGSDGAISERSEEIPRRGPNITLKKKKKEVTEPLETPDFVKAINYERCNCKHGIPSGDLDFIPLPQPYMVGDIKIMTYHVQKALPPRAVSLHAQEVLHQRLLKQIAEFIPHILSFLPLGQCAHTAITCSSWNQGANAYGPYRDLRDSIPWQLYKPHQVRVEAVAMVGNRLFSGGDRRVFVSDLNTGETLHQITRDTGSIPLLLHHEGGIYCCSSNGAIRVFGLMHNVKRIHLDLTMWEHSKRVTSVIFGEKSVGNCDLHGIENHICRMFTASEDRLIRVWDTEIHLPVKTIRSKMMRTQTPQCLAKSSRHLFAGTSAGTVMIFSLHNVCERDDVHNCWSGVEDSQNRIDEIGIVRETKGGQPAMDRSYCLQITLRLPFVKTENADGNTSCVSTILCSGPNYQLTHLFSGDSSGRLTIWEIPEIGLEYQPVKTWRPHKRRLSDMKATYKHLITIGEDGVLVFHDLQSFDRIRRLNFMEWVLHKELVTDGSGEIPRALTCMALVENFETGGTLVLGTSFGELSVIGIGTHV